MIERPGPPVRLIQGLPAQPECVADLICNWAMTYLVERGLPRHHNYPGWATRKLVEAYIALTLPEGSTRWICDVTPCDLFYDQVADEQILVVETDIALVLVSRRRYELLDSAFHVWRPAESR